MGLFQRALGFFFGRPVPRASLATQRTREDDDVEQEDKTPNHSEPATPNSWIAYQDAYGRPFWRNNVTGQWTYNLTTPNYFPGQGGPFWPPSPLPAFQHAAPWNGGMPVGAVQVPVVLAKPKKEIKKKKKEEGRWETIFETGKGKYWRQTVTKEVKYSNPNS